jgi:DNA-binding NtrC family response regulator
MPRPKHILIVDDHVNGRIAIAALLDDAGFVVDEAGNLREARACLAAGAPYGAFLLDAYLGNDESGLDLIAESRAHSPDAIVVIVTGDDTLVRSGIAGADAVFDKSRGVEPILDEINRVRECLP